MLHIYIHTHIFKKEMNFSNGKISFYIFNIFIHKINNSFINSQTICIVIFFYELKS